MALYCGCLTMQILNTALFASANLIAYYRCESGALTTDSKGSYTLTNQGSVAESTGQFGGASNPGTPNADNGVLYRTSTFPALGSSNFSIVNWVKFNDTTAVSYFGNWCDSANDVFSRFTWGPNNLGAGQPGYLFYRVKSGVAQQGPTLAGTPTTGVWMHIGVTYDGTNVRGYIGGALVAGPTAASGNGSVGETGGIGFGIDGQDFDTVTTASTCQLDDIGFFDAALSADNMALLARPGSGGFFNLL